MLLLAALLASLGSPGQDPRDEMIARAVYEDCPKVVTGSLPFGDPAQIEAAGYRPAATTKEPNRGVRGEGDVAVFVARNVVKSGRITCGVSFGGPDNLARFDTAIAYGSLHGYQGEPASELPPWMRLATLASSRPEKMLIVFTAFHGPDLPFSPHTIVVVQGK